jgi:hypothetical protein
MKKLSSVLGLVVLVSVVISCSIVNRLIPVGGEQMSRASELWSDVPRMDGLAPSDLEMPLMIKVMVRAALNNLWRLNKEGEDRTPATGDWIVFTLSGAPAEVEKFYTSPRMSQFGSWKSSDKSTCMDGQDKGFDGVLCVFQKVVDNKQTGLAIIAVQDEKKHQTNVFFLRVEQPEEEKSKNSV